MSSKFASFMIFVVGAAVGSAATWKYIKKKYEKIAQDEIDSVKEVFSKKEAEPADENGSAPVIIKSTRIKEKPDIVEYTARLNELGYTNYAGVKDKNKKEDGAEAMDKPYVISPDEFGEVDDYETISLIYYADSILTDDNDDLIEDVENVVGFESLGRFGEYEDDSVFVRNDRLRCDYEILLDQRKCSDVIRKRPY